MKRLIPLACIALLLSGCPDTKLPKPTPMVPAPKAAPSEVKTQAILNPGTERRL